MSGRLLTTREVGDRLGVTPETTLRWIDTRGLPVIRLTSRALRYDEDELEAWVAEHSTGAAVRGVLPARPNRAHEGAYAEVPFSSLPVPPLNAATTEEEP